MNIRNISLHHKVLAACATLVALAGVVSIVCCKVAVHSGVKRNEKIRQEFAHSNDVVVAAAKARSKQFYEVMLNDFEKYRASFSNEIECLRIPTYRLGLFRRIEDGTVSDMFSSVGVSRISDYKGQRVGIGALESLVFCGNGNAHVYMNFHNTASEKRKPVVVIRFYGPLMEYIGSVEESWRWGALGAGEKQTTDDWITPAPLRPSRPVYYKVEYRNRSGFFD